MLTDTGGRFTARWLGEDAEGARFALELSTAEGIWSTEAAVSLAAGEVTWQHWTGSGEPPPWLVHYARSALRSAWRAHNDEGWPRRLTRWRGPPEVRRSGEGSD
jgi:hypothetical protein